MRFTIYQEGRQGARHSNQDRIGYVHTNDCLLMVVCDGMGGHLRGELASQYVIEFLARAFRQAALPKLRDPTSFLSKTILGAHQGIIAYAAANGMPETPRTTCVAAILQEGRAWWANVGDSRLYMIREGIIHNRTVDHSHVQTLIDSGVLTPEQAAVHPDRNKIYNCLGQPSKPRIDVTKSVALLPDDILLLATDGLWGPLAPDLVAATLSSRDLPVSLPLLLDLAEAVSGRECDNLSAVALKWVANDGLPKDVISRGFNPEIAEVDDADVDLALEMVSLATFARPSFRIRSTT